MMKKLLCICAALTVIFAFAPKVSAVTLIDDGAGLFNEKQEAELYALAADLENKTGWHIAVVTTNTGFGTGGSRAKQYALDYYAEHFGVNQAGVLYLIDLDYRYIHIEGAANDYFSNSRVNAMLDQTEARYLDYDDMGTVKAFYSNVGYYYDKGIVTDASYPYGVSTSDSPYGVPIGLGCGVLAAVIGVFIVLRRYKTHRAPSANTYMSGRPPQFYVRSDIFVREYTTRTRIDSSSSGGGGGGGRRTGGGGRGGRR